MRQMQDTSDASNLPRQIQNSQAVLEEDQSKIRVRPDKANLETCQEAFKERKFEKFQHEVSPEGEGKKAHKKKRVKSSASPTQLRTKQDYGSPHDKQVLTNCKSKTQKGKKVKEQKNASSLRNSRSKSKDFVPLGPWITVWLQALNHWYWGTSLRLITPWSNVQDLWISWFMSTNDLYHLGGTSTFASLSSWVLDVCVDWFSKTELLSWPVEMLFDKDDYNS